MNRPRPHTFHTAMLVLVLLAGCSTDTGTRSAPPHARVSSWSLWFWPGANATQRLWLKETATETDALLRSHLHGEVVPAAKLVFYELQSGMLIAHNALTTTYGYRLPLATNSLRLSVGFVDPFTRDVHYWVRSGLRKYEGEELAHLMLHAVIDDPLHWDPRWQTYASDAWFLQQRIAARR